MTESSDGPVSEEMSIADLVEANGRLTSAVEALTGSLKENTDYLNEKIKALDRADRRRKRSIRWAFATIVADLAVTSMGLFIWHAQADTNRRIQESLKTTYVTAAQQAQTRVRVLCPLYTVFLTVAADPARSPLTPEQRALFDANVAVIRDGYMTLGCKPDLPALVTVR